MSIRSPEKQAVAQVRAAYGGNNNSQSTYYDACVSGGGASKMEQP